jgi:hypothetical protein
VDAVRELFRLTADDAAQCHESLDERPVHAEASFEELCATLGGPLPEVGADDEHVIAELIAGGEPVRS